MRSPVIAVWAKPAEPFSTPGILVPGSVGLRNVRMRQDKGVYRGAIDLYVIEQDTAGKVQWQNIHRLNLQLTDAQYRDYLQSGISFRESVASREDMAILRVVVEDPSTAVTGSLIISKNQIK